MLGKRRWERTDLTPIGFTWEEHRASLEARQSFRGLQVRFARADGAVHIWSLAGEPFYSTDGRFLGYRGIGSDTTRAFRDAALKGGERRLFERLAAGAPQSALLAEACRTLEAVLARPGTALMMRLDRDGLLRPAAGPSVAAQLLSAIDANGIRPAADAITCGEAAFRNAVAVCPNIAADPRWASCLEVARSTGVCAAWSTPIRASSGAVIGTLGVLHPVCAAPAETDLEAARNIASLAGVLVERFEAEARLRESEARFRQLTLLSSDWYWEQDRDYRFISTEEVAGRRDKPIGESIGLTRWERPGTRPVGTTWEAHREDLKARRSFAHLVLEITLPDGLRRYVAVRGEPVFDAAGEFTGYRGTGTDITERYRADLVRSGERHLFELFSADAALEELMEILCRTFESALARPGVASVYLAEAGELRLAAGASLDAEYRTRVRTVPIGDACGSCGTCVHRNEVVVCRDLSTDPLWDGWRDAVAPTAYASCWSTPIRGAAGQVIGTIAIYAKTVADPDASDRELMASAASLAGVLIERFRAASAERESEQRYRSLVEVSQDGVMVSDGGRILYANPGLARILKVVDAQELLGRDFADMVLPEYRPLLRERTRRVSVDRVSLGYVEVRIVCMDGGTADIEICGTPIEVGGRRLVQSNLRDISARKWAERELKVLNETLEQRVAERTAELSQANQALEAFSYTVAHDLRAPLRAIDGYARLLIEDASERLTEAMLRDLETIRRTALRMAGLIDGLLDFSRLAREPAARSTVSMRSLAESVAAEILADPAGGAQRRPRIRVGTLPEVMGDMAMLRQVWSNLIGNAVKFSATTLEPEVTIDCAGVGDEHVFSVRDNGVGFDDRYADKLFGVFQRLHSQTSFPGTGVGLAIVQRIIERHGGRVFAESRPGQGATFSFTLPGRVAPGTSVMTPE
ncbi:MAG: GAF domain-containing protein [Burkholderiales bacterium]|nr:GAF domain-containing protein [Burkholderiales bacterium]